MSRMIVLLVLLALAFGVASGQTIELVLHCGGGPVPASAATEISTGLLDCLFAEGMIVTTSGAPASANPDMATLLAASKEGRVDLLLFVQATWPVAGSGRNLPDSFSWSLHRVMDGSLIASGFAALDNTVAQRQADSIKNLRKAGDIMAKAALPAMRRAFAFRAPGLGPSGRGVAGMALGALT